ncbi:M9 family metallopeptidase [Microbulbifer sp. CAU 1566]|uniref:M9 family metallopeptidase n=1 Tax=Microbulbifer sp. CAU 1566 TaxID=2933269 RepID=UPI002005F317|nr:M9 family metallopeptidase [Microbulbifer sp. CAU 1566]MCK7596722.1 M9 family metallopeptidase [Microbulbifer sp. CAU 1566]
MKNNHITLSIHGLLTGLAATLLGAALQAHAAPMPATPTTSTASDFTISAPVEPRYNPEQLQQATPQVATLQLQNFSLLAVEPLATCDATGYAQYSGQALVDHILQSESSCINDLYDGNSTSFASFTNQKMVTVANAAQQMAADYSAADGDASINKLFYFLRTGYYIEYYYPDEVSFSSNVQSAVVGALDTFIANPDFYALSSTNGSATIDAIVLIDSSEENTRYLPMVKEWLQRWNAQAAAISSMRASVNGIFTVLFRGHYSSTFVSTAGSDTQLMQLLGNFARSDWMLDSEAQFMQENAARELTRFLQHTTSPAYDTVVAQTQQVLDRYSMMGTGQGVWIAAAGNADYYGDCADFDICGFEEDLQQQVLANNYTCSSSLKIRAQDMSTVEFADSCDQLADQETYFHQLLNTNYNPVADDLNTDLEVVVFDDWDEYNTYASLFYGINTNNGGMYLEGDPATEGNQARFIAHEADWLRPDFEVWNLTHEYVHYLDGRFNLYGGFGDAQTGSHKIVWWIEGLAEYVSKKDYNDSAVDLGRSGTYNLSEIFGNTYSSGQDRVYRWGYLAVRFMFEKHHNDVIQLLSYLRAGNYDAYLNYVNNIGTSYDSEWQTWLQQVESTTDGDNGGDDGGDDGGDNGGGDDGGDTGSDTPSPIVNNQEITGISVATQGEDTLYYIDVPANAESLSIAISGGTGDADLYVRHGSEPTDNSYDCRPYIGGNTEVCDIASPQAGRWYIRLKAYSAFSGVNLLASFTEAATQACSGTPVGYGNLELNTSTCITDGNSINYYYTYIPAGTSSLTIKLFGGEGNGDLYVNDATWASSSDYDQRSTNSDNNESITINSPDSGWYYFSVLTSEGFSGAGIQLIAN